MQTIVAWLESLLLLAGCLNDRNTVCDSSAVPLGQHAEQTDIIMAIADE